MNKIIVALLCVVQLNCFAMRRSRTSEVERKDWMEKSNFEMRARQAEAQERCAMSQESIAKNLEQQTESIAVLVTSVEKIRGILSAKL